MSFSVSPVTDRRIWDTFLKHYCPGAIFQSWPWGEVAENTGHHVERFGMYENSDLVGIMQIQTVSAKRGTFLHIRHGPVLASFDKKIWNETIDVLRKKAKDSRALFVRISPHVPESDELLKLFARMGLTPAAIHAMDAEYCWVLDISRSEDELLLGMRKTTRYEIKRSVSMGVEIGVWDNADNIDTFMRLYKETSARQGFVPHTGIEEEFEIFSGQKQAILVTGSYQGDVTAAAIILFHNGEAIYHHGASIPTKAPVNYAVQWRAIQESKKRGMHQYNFWGIAPDDKPDHPWKGITLFKTGFGGKAVRFFHAHDLPTSPLYALPRAIETLRRLKKGY